MFAELSKILSIFDRPADWIGLRGVREVKTTRSVRDGLPEQNSQALTQGVMVEVLVNGQLGYGATNSLQPVHLQRAAEQAYQSAIVASHHATHQVTLADRPPVVGHYTSPFLKPFTALTAGEINEVLVKICQTLKVSDRIVKTNAMVITTETESWFLSSNGSEVYQKVLRLATDYTATAQEGTRTQQRSDNGWLARSYQGGMEHFLTSDLWDRVKCIGEQAVQLLSAEDCPTMKTNLVLAPDQMLLQLHESVGHPLELDRILGDERNYAGGSFVKVADFGHLAYGSPLMNITFDPTLPGEFASYGFDDTGVPATREYLIKHGQLMRGLGGLESQARGGVSGVACARACSWNRPPIDRMANLNLEPGTSSLDQIIATVEQGVYMHSTRSWSIDDQRHKFQFGCEYAQLIENGTLTKPLRNPNYRATTLEFWRNLVQVGDRSTWQVFGSPVCGKGEPNQIIWVGHGSPVCAFANVEVFGGGS